jgi:hypothetical protein
MLVEHGLTSCLSDIIQVTDDQYLGIDFGEDRHVSDHSV